MKVKRIILMLVSLVVILSVMGCNKKDELKKENIKNVKTDEVRESSIIIEDQFAGKITALDYSGVVPKIPGIVSQLYVDIGERVNKGDLLFELDSTDYAAQLRQAETVVEFAKTGLNRAQGSNLSQLQIQYKSIVEQAKISYDDAKTNYTKIKSLYDNGAISKNELDTADIRVKASKEQLDSSTQNLELLKSGIGPDSVEGAQTQLNQAVAAVELVKTQMNNLKVYSPIAGVISKKSINVGESVSGGEVAIEVSNVDNLAIDLSIPQKLINKISVGQKITMSIDSLKNQIIQGEVRNIDPVASDNSYNYNVKLKLLSNNSEIKPGMFCRAKLPVDQKDKVVTVPNTAVISENGIQFVYMISGGKINKKSVSIGLSNDKITEILAGLNIGDKIIFEGQSFLNDGEKVNVVS